MQRKETYYLFLLLLTQKSRSRPPSFAGGDSPVLRSRSSTCDSIQSSSSPIANCPSRQFTLPSGVPAYPQSAGTSPKQHVSMGQYLSGGAVIDSVGRGCTNAGGGGGSSPSSASSQSGRISRSIVSSELVHIPGARKSTSAGRQKIFHHHVNKGISFFCCMCSKYEFSKKTYSTGSTAWSDINC